jgi:hypothetical protein
LENIEDPPLEVKEKLKKIDKKLGSLNRAKTQVTEVIKHVKL